MPGFPPPAHPTVIPESTALPPPLSLIWGWPRCFLSARRGVPHGQALGGSHPRSHSPASPLPTEPACESRLIWAREPWSQTGTGPLKVKTSPRQSLAGGFQPRGKNTSGWNQACGPGRGTGHWLPGWAPTSSGADSTHRPSGRRRCVSLWVSSAGWGRQCLSLVMGALTAFLACRSPQTAL